MSCSLAGSLLSVGCDILRVTVLCKSLEDCKVVDLPVDQVGSFNNVTTAEQCAVLTMLNSKGCCLEIVRMVVDYSPVSFAREAVEEVVEHCQEVELGSDSQINPVNNCKHWAVEICCCDGCLHVV